MKKSVKVKFIISIVLWAVTGINMFLFHSFPSFFFPWYRSLSQKWIALLAGICSIVRIAVWDILLVLLVAGFLAMTIRDIVHRKPFLQWLSAVVISVSVIMAIVVNGWMLNHYAPTLGSQISLEVEQYSVEQLADACEYYMEKAAEYAPLIERDANGSAILPDFYQTARKAGSSYAAISGKYPVFNGSARPVKKLSLVGEYLMFNGIVGMFMPFTGEAGVPGSVPPIPLAYTMCHEAAHRLGIASEQEANFAAFLACVESDDPYFLYSGYYNAFSYSFSSLYRADSETAVELYNRYPDDRGMQLVKQDRQETWEYYQKYESPLQDISDEINDRYLKTFSQESGIQSYGEVTDYLIAYWLKYGNNG